MRLPADAALIVVGALKDARATPAGAKIEALIEAWRREDLPAFVIGGERDASHAEAFADGRLQARLDDLGATTLVMCGEEAAVEGAARAAAALGFQTFVVADACWGVGATMGAQSSNDARTVVDAETALAAAAVAKARQRRAQALASRRAPS